MLNGDTRQLLGDGTEVHLSPKALSLLLMLLEERLRAVSKAELQAALWPSTFVGEANLTTLVREIRRLRTLGCCATVTRFVSGPWR